MKPIAVFASLLLAAGAFAADIEGVDQQTRRIHESTAVLSEMMDAKDRTVMINLLQKAHCVGIVPGLKRAGFIVGAKYGKGVMTCRVSGGVGWSAPSTIRMEGGNFGLQIGIGETDLIFVVMDKIGEEHLIKDNFMIGSEASAMGGPVGRATIAGTDLMMTAEILGYSRSRGLFAGISLDGATLRPDNSDNRKIYGLRVSENDILHGKVKAPASANGLFAELNRYAPELKKKQVKTSEKPKS